MAAVLGFASSVPINPNLDITADVTMASAYFEFLAEAGQISSSIKVLKKRHRRMQVSQVPPHWPTLHDISTHTAVYIHEYML